MPFNKSFGHVVIIIIIIIYCTFTKQSNISELDKILNFKICSIFIIIFFL